MKDMAYKWQVPDPLSVELTKPVREVSIECFGPLGMPYYVTLWRPDGSGLRICSEVRQVAERVEIGVLGFEHFKAPSGNEVMLVIDPEFNQQNDAFKLVVHDEGITAESGMLLRAMNGSEIVIAAGGFPFTIAVRGVVEQAHIFEPEYSMEHFERLPIELGEL